MKKLTTAQKKKVAKFVLVAATSWFLGQVIKFERKMEGVIDEKVEAYFAEADSEDK